MTERKWTTKYAPITSETDMKKIFGLLFLVLTLASFARAQASAAEITVTLNERFFDALLDAVFTNLKPPSFPLAENDSKFKVQSSKSAVAASGFRESVQPIQNPICDESIRLQREIDGVKTAVRFRDGKIYAPVAFAGSYNPPFVGCVDFQGYAETNVDVEFDKEKQVLIGRARVLNVVLSGTNGVGSSFVTKLVQSAIDKKINPIQILQADKFSFNIPIENAGGALKMRATNVHTEIANGALNVVIGYEFVKN